MAMSVSVRQLREMSDDELMQLHDGEMINTVVGTAHYLGELRHREIARQTNAMLQLTKVIAWLTGVVTVATVVNVIVFILN